MEVIKMLVDGREAIPVRALPFITGWMVTPNALAQELAAENGKPRLTAYWENGGCPFPITPEAWGVVLDQITDLTRTWKNKETEPDEHRQAGRREAIEKLPPGAFVWLDEAARWVGSAFFANDTVWDEVHWVPGEDDDPCPVFYPRRGTDLFDLTPIIQPDERRLIVEGMEPYFEIGGSSTALQTADKLNSAEASSQPANFGLTPGLPAAATDGIGKPPAPWWIKVPGDPEPKGFQPWYTPARYFARGLVRDDSTLLNKRDLLACKVAEALSKAGIYKRGGKKPLDPATVKKALGNITFT